jgi:hypothetical protein
LRLPALNRMVEVLLYNLTHIQVGAVVLAWNDEEAPAALCNVWGVHATRSPSRPALWFCCPFRASSTATPQMQRHAPAFVSACTQNLWPIFLTHLMEVLHSGNAAIRAAGLEALDKCLTGVRCVCYSWQQ